MKHPFSFLPTLLLILFFTTTHAQQNWGACSQKLAVKNYVGMRFKFHGRVRAELEDDSASAHLWLRVDKASGFNYFDDMQDRPVRHKEWKRYVLEGTFKEGSEQIAFGAFCVLNGRFYFDDLLLEIETKKNTWTTVYRADFENGINDLQPGIQSHDYGLNPAYTTNIVDDAGAKNNHCLEMSGKEVPNFGMNKKAGKFAEVNGIKLYYEIYGQGHPLLVLHGNGGSIENASRFYPELMKTYKVIAIDSRAQGYSGNSNEPLTYDLMASDINQLLNQLNIDSAYIWGQSDGAILGLLLAMDYPKKVSKVLAFGSNIQSDTLALYPKDVRSCIKTCRESKNAKEARLNCLMAYYPNMPYTKLHGIKAPVLVMAGDRDMIRPEHTLKIFQNIPNSQLFIVPGATHGACWEKPELFLQTLHAFFDKPFEMPNSDAMMGEE